MDPLLSFNETQWKQEQQHDKDFQIEGKSESHCGINTTDRKTK